MAKLTALILLLPMVSFGAPPICSNGQAISTLSPGASWIMRNDDLSTLQWNDPSDRPADADIAQAVEDCQSAQVDAQATLATAQNTVASTNDTPAGWDKMTTDEKLDALKSILTAQSVVAQAALPVSVKTQAVKFK